jgi:RNA polymerase sigma-70 factor (ECF subfamily)
MNFDALPDPELLLQQARTKNGDARGQLLELYRGYLALLARLQIGRRLQGKIDAADLVQETFLEAHRHFALFQGNTEAEFVSWLRQILAARLAKLVRRYLGTQRRNVRLERELSAELEQSSRVLDEGLVARSSSPSHRAARREQAVLLAGALEELPDDYREVLILRHLEGLTFLKRLCRICPKPPAMIWLLRWALPRKSTPKGRWVITGSSARSAVAAWASSTRPCRFRWAGGWR